MAQGDVIVFDQFMRDVFDADIGHDFGATPHTVKCAIVDSTLAPTEAATDPRWGAGGSTDFSVNEVTIAGDYVAGGNECATASITLSGGDAFLDFGDPAAWTTGTDTDARWGIIYNDTLAGKQAIAYVDLGSSFDMSTGTLTIQWGTPAIRIRQAP